jgi:predicted O-methyltransferase YrrM
MDFINADIQAYSEQFTSPSGDLLDRLYRETHLKILYPRMLSGHLQGRLLAMISKMQRPKTILEIGTYTGYSAICLAEGLQAGGMLHTIDINAELEDFASRYFEEAGIASQVRMHVGKALEIIPTLGIAPDLVFIDADKDNYSRYLDLVVPMMPSGGIIIGDNVLWSGNVVDPNVQDKETQGLRRFVEHVAQDDRLEQVLLPVRDGILLARKK